MKLCWFIVLCAVGGWGAVSPGSLPAPVFPAEEIVLNRTAVCSFCWSKHNSACVVGISAENIDPFPYSNSVVNAYICAYSGTDTMPSQNISFLFDPTEDSCSEIPHSYFCPVGVLKNACSSCILREQSKGGAAPCIDVDSYVRTKENYCLESSIYECEDYVLGGGIAGLWCGAQFYVDFEFADLRGTNLIESVRAQIAGSETEFPSLPFTMPEERRFPFISDAELEFIDDACTATINYDPQEIVPLYGQMVPDFIGDERGYCLNIVSFPGLSVVPSGEGLLACSARVGFSIWCPDYRMFTLYTLGVGMRSPSSFPLEIEFGNRGEYEEWFDEDYLLIDNGDGPGEVPELHTNDLHFIAGGSNFVAKNVYVDRSGGVFDTYPKVAYETVLASNDEGYRIGPVLPQRVAGVACSSVALIVLNMALCSTGEIFTITPLDHTSSMILSENDSNFIFSDATTKTKYQTTSLIGVLDMSEIQLDNTFCWKSRTQKVPLQTPVDDDGEDVYRWHFNDNILRQARQSSPNVKSATWRGNADTIQLVVVTRDNCVVAYDVEIDGGSLQQERHIVHSGAIRGEVVGLSKTERFVYAYNKTCVWRYLAYGEHYPVLQQNYLTFFAVGPAGDPKPPALTMTHPNKRPLSGNVFTVPILHIQKIFPIARDDASDTADIYMVVKRFGLPALCTGCPTEEYTVLSEVMMRTETDVIFRVGQRKLNFSFADTDLSSATPIVDICVSEHNVLKLESRPLSGGGTFEGVVAQEKETVLIMALDNALKAFKLRDGTTPVLFAKLYFPGGVTPVSVSLASEVIGNLHYQKIFVGLHDGFLVYLRTLHELESNDSPDFTGSYIFVGGTLTKVPFVEFYNDFDDYETKNFTGHGSSPWEGSMVIDQDQYAPGYGTKNTDAMPYLSATPHDFIGGAVFTGTTNVIAYFSNGVVTIFNTKINLSVKTIALRTGNGVAVVWMRFLSSTRLIVCSLCTHGACPVDDSLAAVVHIDFPYSNPSVDGVMLSDDDKRTHSVFTAANGLSQAFNEVDGCQFCSDLLALWSMDPYDGPLLYLYDLRTLDFLPFPSESGIGLPLPTDAIRKEGGGVFMGPFLVIMGSTQLYVYNVSNVEYPHNLYSSFNVPSAEELTTMDANDVAARQKDLMRLDENYAIEYPFSTAEFIPTGIWMKRVQNFWMGQNLSNSYDAVIVRSTAVSRDCVENCDMLQVFRMEHVDSRLFDNPVGSLRYSSAINAHPHFAENYQRGIYLPLHVPTLHGVEEYFIDMTVVNATLKLTPIRVMSREVVSGGTFSSMTTVSFDYYANRMLTVGFTGTGFQRFDKSYLLWDAAHNGLSDGVIGEYKISESRCSFTDSNNNARMEALHLEMQNLEGQVPVNFQEGGAWNWAFTAPYCGKAPRKVEQTLFLQGGGTDDVLEFNLLLYSEGGRIAFLDADVFLPGLTQQRHAQDELHEVARLSYSNGARRLCGTCSSGGAVASRDDALSLAFGVIELNNLYSFSYQRQEAMFDNIAVENDKKRRAGMEDDVILVERPAVNRRFNNEMTNTFEWFQVIHKTNAQETLPTRGKLLVASTGFHLYLFDIRKVNQMWQAYSSTIQSYQRTLMQDPEMSAILQQLNLTEPPALSDFFKTKGLFERFQSLYEGFDAEQNKFLNHPPILQPVASAKLPKLHLAEAHELQYLHLVQIKRDLVFHHALTNDGDSSYTLYATWGPQMSVFPGAYRELNSYHRVSEALLEGAAKNLYIYKISFGNEITQLRAVPLMNVTYYQGAFYKSKVLIVLSSRPVESVGGGGMEGCANAQSEAAQENLYSLNFFTVFSQKVGFQGQLPIEQAKIFPFLAVHTALIEAGDEGASPLDDILSLDVYEQNYYYTVNFSKVLSVAVHKTHLFVHFQMMLIPSLKDAAGSQMLLPPRNCVMESIQLFKIHYDFKSHTLGEPSKTPTLTYLMRGDITRRIFDYPMSADNGKRIGADMKFKSRTKSNVMYMFVVDGSASKQVTLSVSDAGDISLSGQDTSKPYTNIVSRDVFHAADGGFNSLLYDEEMDVFRVTPFTYEPPDPTDAPTTLPPTQASTAHPTTPPHPPTATPTHNGVTVAPTVPNRPTSVPSTAVTGLPQSAPFTTPKPDNTPVPTEEEEDTDANKHSGLPASTVIVVVVPSLLGTLCLLLVGTWVFLHFRRWEEDDASDGVGFLEHVVQMDDLQLGESLYTPV